MGSVKTGKWIKLLGVILLVLVTVLAWIRLAPENSMSSRGLSSEASRMPDQVYLGTRDSLAVLPFAAPAIGDDLEFWPIGFSTELHRLLTRVKGLRVTSRNSSFFFHEAPVGLPLAAERLQVSRLLSGEIDMAGGQIIINARLFDARRRQVDWSRTWQGELKEVFRIQDQIVDLVADTFGRESSASLPMARPVDMRAWQAFIRGIHFSQKRTPDAAGEAEAAFRFALELEPGFEQARIELAGVLLASVAMGAAGPAALDESRRLLRTALKNQPDSPEALGLLSYIRHSHDWDWLGALQAAEEAVSLRPGDPELMATASLAMFSLGRFDDAEELLDAAVRQDPLNLGRRFRLGLLHEFSGNYEQALSNYRQVIGLNAEFPGARAFRARVKILQDKPESAMKESDQEVEPFWRRYSRILALAAAENHDEAASLLDQMIAEDGHRAAFQIAEILAFQGEVERAFEWLERAIEQRDGGLKELVGNPLLAKLRADPKWQNLLRRMGYPLDLENLSYYGNHFPKAVPIRNG